MASKVLWRSALQSRLSVASVGAFFCIAYVIYFRMLGLYSDRQSAQPASSPGTIGSYGVSKGAGEDCSNNAQASGPGTSNAALPFHWFKFCRDSDVTLLDPAGQVKVPERMGKFMGVGETVYGFQVEKSGAHSIQHLGRTVAQMQLHPDSFNATYSCPSATTQAIRDAYAAWTHHPVSEETFLALTEKRDKDPRWALHVTIIDNRLYTFPHMYPAIGRPRSFSDVYIQVLMSTLRKVRVADVELILTLGDGASITKKDAIPVLTIAAHPDYIDIPAAISPLVREYFSGDIFRSACAVPPWQDRLPKAYFWGASTGGITTNAENLYQKSRFVAASLSVKRPDLIEARVVLGHNNTLYGAWEEAVQKGLNGSYAPKPAIVRHKYQLDLDGNTASFFRIEKILLSGSVLLKERSPWIRDFYPFLQDGVNSIDVERNMADLVRKLEWLQAHDEEAERIAVAGFNLAMELLRTEDIFCSMAVHLETMRASLGFEPKIREGMEEVFQGSQEGCACVETR